MMVQTSAHSDTDYERLATIREQMQRAYTLIQSVPDFSRRAVLECGPLNLGIFLKEQVKLRRWLRLCTQSARQGRRSPCLPERAAGRFHLRWLSCYNQNC